MIARPSPRVAPVTSATRPARLKRSNGAADRVLLGPCARLRLSALQWRDQGLLRPKAMPAGLVDLLRHRSAVDEDVEMPEHLPDREHGLRLRRPRPTTAAGDLERGARAVLDARGDQVEPCRVERHALVDQRGGGRRSSGRGPGSRCASCITCVLRRLLRYSRSARRRSSPGSSVGISSAPDVMCASRWSPTNASPASSSTNSVSVVQCPGRKTARSVRPPATIRVAVPQRTRSVSKSRALATM